VTAADVALRVSVVNPICSHFACSGVCNDTPNDNDTDIKKRRRKLKGLRNMVRTVL
jgi:Fe-S cluster assembly iron-binding protein IscA